MIVYKSKLAFISYSPMKKNTFYKIMKEYDLNTVQNNL